MSNSSVPVLLYHHINYDDDIMSVSPELFEEQLKFLKSEGYVSIGAQELAEFMTTGKKEFKKAVVITIDDGYLDTWVYAYPLLKKYGFKAIAFIVSWNVEEDEFLGFNLDDYYEGKITKDMIPKCSANFVIENGIKKRLERRLCWREVREMDKTGIIDIEPHSKFHRKVYASDKMIGFNHPKDILTAYSSVKGDERLGTPDFERKPEFVAREFTAYQDLRDRLVQHVRSNGYLKFFEKDGWEKELTNIVDDYKKEKNTDKIGEWETEEEQIKRIRMELEVSKGEIGWEVKKICKAFSWPWGAYNDTSLQIAKEVGFEYIFTTNPGSNSYGDSPYEIKRLGIWKKDLDWFKSIVRLYSEKVENKT